MKSNKKKGSFSAPCYIEHLLLNSMLSDRPFNLKGEGGVMVSCFVQNFFFGQHKSQNIFFQNLTLGYMRKTQIICFSLHQNQNIFSATLGIRIFFQKKTKLNGRSLRIQSKCGMGKIIVLRHPLYNHTPPSVFIFCFNVRLFIISSFFGDKGVKTLHFCIFLAISWREQVTFQ